MTTSTAPPADALSRVRAEIAKAVVGQDRVVTGIMIALLAGGHVLLEGVPGVGKTLLAKSLAGAMSLDMGRVQFTPDLMPADVTGQLVFDQDSGGFSFRRGPVFTNILLADEINRTPPRTQAALLEAMEEHQVSMEGQSHPLPDPFIVLATQNPVEHEGTYPLPEAQLDRFLFKLDMTHPSAEEEAIVLARHEDGLDPHNVKSVGVTAVAGAAEIIAARAAVQETVRTEPVVREYMVALARATREAPGALVGVSTRGIAMLLHAARAWAFLQGRTFVTPDDVKSLAPSAMRHRIVVRPEAALDGLSSDDILQSALQQVPAPR